MKFPVRMVGRHGAMHAYSTSEVAHLQSLGWSVEVPDPPVVPVINGDTSREPEDVLKEALAESMRLDPPPSVPDAPPAETKRKPGRPRKVA